MRAPFSTVTDDALADHDMVGLLAELAAGRVHPNELFAAAWERAEHAEPLNAVVSWVPPSTSVDGPFAGIPTFVKDDEEVQGVATTNGSRAVPDTPAEEDSPFAQQLRQLGLAFVGKSALPEFGLMPTTEPLAHGPTRNPWDLSRSTGGSSGGAAALVAAGVVPIATGNDGGGSIRIPASCCGVVGLKPSRNRLQPTAEAEILPLDIITYGVHTRSVRDTAAFYREIEKIHCELPPIGDVVGPG
ncbi:MAG: amidase family protein, partial [Actinomycetes bacterium]